MKARKLFWITLFFFPICTLAQTKPDAQLGCSQNQRPAFYDKDLKFIAMTSSEAIKQWKTRPVFVAEGFESAKYGFARAEFYRWHVPVPGREGSDKSIPSSSTDRLALAVHVVGPRGEHWFELANPEQDSDDVLYIQPLAKDESSADSTDESQRPAKTPSSDEMAAWMIIQSATPDAKLPLFRLDYEHSDTGMYQTETTDHLLLLDLRTGTPHIAKALTCMVFEPTSGACSAQDEASEGHEALQCQWDDVAGDFRCTKITPYGGSQATRTAQRDFYLLSDKPAKTKLESESLADLGQLALRARDNPQGQTKAIFVARLGATTLLQHFSDLLPGTDVFVFASPGAGDMLNAHLSLVTVPGDGKPVVQAISKWAISGEETDETTAPEGYLPVSTDDAYRTHILEQRSGFRAFDAILSIPMGATHFHIVYWIGIEVADGKLVAGAVRLAGDSYTNGGCGQEFHEGTAASIKQKAATAEATLRVQGQFNPEYTTPYPSEGPNCVWTSLLHWKPGAGFRARKLAENCKSAHQEVKITDDGVVSAQPVSKIQ